jgi:hypothetical protein
MKLTIYTLLFGLIMLQSNLTSAQNLIAVQNGGAPAFYQQVDDAILNAHDGDTIYIPGGSWSITKPINKRLSIIGVGHNPDSTSATFSTTLTGSLTLAAGSSNGTLTGVSLSGAIFGTNDPVNSYTVSRCRVNSIFLTASNNNFTFIENVVISTVGSSSNYVNASNCSFFNNIFLAYFIAAPYIAFINSIFKNNIFLSSATCGTCVPISCQYSTLENNIFVRTSAFVNVLNSEASNNMFCDASIPNGTNVGLNNIFSQGQNSFFINYQFGNPFSYTNDFHLKSNCPGKNAGTDGTDIGIYGGLYPWKEGSIPTNPHIQAIKVGPTTDADGNLKVIIKVKAQDN